MYKILVTLIVFSVICFSVQVKAEDADTAPPEQKKEKSELAKLLEKVDQDYKALQALSGYTSYKKKHWKLIKKSGENILDVAKILRRDYARPEDRKYEQLMKKMQDSAKSLVKVAKNNKKEGAVEDAQWYVRKLQQTCSLCHKHLDIHIYPQLFEGKKSEMKEKRLKK
ncbi:splicing factor 3a subunit 3 [Candidatus Scalindua japonica]|uniref:Splicing factor 3a subunit 3 n=1 Tax=Candidatus Scalindua japonica TaxID=1284222 RepID=A0A286U329_9BACT|nr:hypothetical protein [Candidatus Scalindua japonica]GAX62527.1 splicing factor 3a subunit 3 [Candidatus Scalindua japonica]